VKRSKITSTRHKYAELLKMASFYKRSQPNLHALNLLKIMGFQIAGLQRRLGRVLPSPRPHMLVWNPQLQWGICLCGKWELLDAEEARVRHNHKMHARLASRQGCEKPLTDVISSRRSKPKSGRVMGSKWRMRCRCESHKILTICLKD